LLFVEPEIQPKRCLAIERPGPDGFRVEVIGEDGKEMAIAAVLSFD
jgi:hypothetical protein